MKNENKQIVGKVPHLSEEHYWFTTCAICLAALVHYLVQTRQVLNEYFDKIMEYALRFY